MRIFYHSILTRFFWRPSLEPKELRSVEIFWSRDISLYIFMFLTVRDNCVMI